MNDTQEGYKLIDAGEYTLKIDDISLHQSKSGSAIYIQVKFSLEDGRVIFDYFVANSASSIAVAIGQLKWVYFLLSQGEVPSLIPSDEQRLESESPNLIGKSVNAKIIQEELQGVKRNKIKNYI